MSIIGQTTPQESREFRRSRGEPPKNHPGELGSGGLPHRRPSATQVRALFGDGFYVVMVPDGLRP